MRLYGMAAAFTESLRSTTAEAMTPDNFLSWLLSREWDYRSEAAIQRSLDRNHGIRTYYANASKLLGLLKVAKTKRHPRNRIAHSAHSIELTGESVRKIKASVK